MKIFLRRALLTAAIVLAGCSHPLEPVGEGDILSASGTRDCLLEDYQAALVNCDGNVVAGGAYIETYTAIARPGWKFRRWENYCQGATDNTCSFNTNAETVAAWAGTTLPPLRAIFTPEPFTLALSAPPSQFADSGADFAADVPYGPDKRNTFDILMPPSAEPNPLIIYIHGGGFRGGNKEKAYTSVNNRAVGLAALANGVAFATIEYRLLQSPESEGVIKSLSDSRRALQYMRLHAETFNIDPDRIAVFGGSAGAGTSLWLGTSDEMANTRSTDPLDRLSSRVLAVGANNTQSTYDIVGWEAVFAEFGITLELIAQVDPSALPRLLDFYAINSMDELYDDPAIVDYRADVDMLGLMDAGDAPIWVENLNGNTGIPTNQGTLFHHVYHARSLRDRADAVGLENVVYAPPIGIVDPSGESLADFLLRHLGVF